MSRNSITLGRSKNDALNKLKAALEIRLIKVEARDPSYLANDVISKLAENEGMHSVGDALMDLEDIVEKLPFVSLEDRNSSHQLLNQITFVDMPENLQGVVREEIANFLNGRLPALLPIQEEKTIRRSTSISDKVFTRHDHLSTTQKRISAGFARPQSAASLLTNNVAQPLPTTPEEKLTQPQPAPARKFTRHDHLSTTQETTSASERPRSSTSLLTNNVSQLLTKIDGRDNTRK